MSFAADASAALVRARTRPWLERHTFLHDLETPDGYLGSLAVLGAVTRVDAREFSTDDLRRALRLPR
jgi:hypothetical protein